MKKKEARVKEDCRKISRERIAVLMGKAQEVFDENKGLANRYVTLARKIAMKYKVRFPRDLKRKICKHCYRFLKPGVNCRVRTQKGKVVYYCLECKNFMRFPCKK